ncbi:MAG: hypothetical protein ACE5JI_00250, partial [Acidobacteriota bacterium]
TDFFLTGSASLVFEVIWTSLLLLSIGATPTAVGAVLAAFMGGMAIGSGLAGRSFFSRRDPILTFAVLEGWAGLYALATPYLLRGVDAASPAWQFVVALLLLLPATIGMGASLPVLSRALGRGSRWPAVEVGRLYAANTAGAVAGPLLAVFSLFPVLGLSHTLHIASGVDLLVFLTLVGARKALPRWETAESGESRRAKERPHGFLLAALGISGATAMVYEMAWTRTLSLVFGSSVYGVTIMLSTFLFGIASGSAGASALLRRRQRGASLSTTGWLLAGSAGGAFLSLMIARSLPLLFVNLYRSAPERDLALYFSQFAISALLMLPATLCLGAMLPVATSVLSASRSELGRKVSWLYTANLIGSALGALLAASLLLGNFGIELSVRAACLLGLTAALALVAWPPTTHLSPARVSVLAAAVLLVLGLDPGGEPIQKGLGFYSHLPDYEAYDPSALRRIIAAHELLYYRDGPTATVAVHKLDRYLLMQINGKTDASNGRGDMQTQVLVAHLPLMAAEARRVAVVGWGSGVTVGSVLSHPVEAVDAFEIEPAVVEASRFFEPMNGKPLQDPRLRLLMGDARTQLARQRKRYDVIVCEPSNPWITGVANLFTRNYFELAASRLEPDGILSQWFHLYGMSVASTRSLLATFRSVFPHVVAFRLPEDRDLILLGSRRPIRFSLVRMRGLFEDPDIRKSLSRGFVSYPFDMLSRLSLDEEGSRAFSQGADLNTDDNMRLELAAPRSLYRNRLAAIRDAMDRHPPGIVELLTDYGSEAEVERELAASWFTTGKAQRALRHCERSLALKTTFEGQRLLGQILQSLDRIDDARKALELALALGGDPQSRRFVQALLRSMDSPASP